MHNEKESERESRTERSDGIDVKDPINKSLYATILIF